MANQCFPCDTLTQKPARLDAPGANSVSGPVFPTLTWLRKPEKHPKSYLFSLTGEGLLSDFVVAKYVVEANGRIFNTRALTNIRKIQQ